MLAPSWALPSTPPRGTKLLQRDVTGERTGERRDRNEKRICTRDVYHVDHVDHTRSPLRTEERFPQELHADFDDELDAHMAENAKLRAGAATE